MAKRGRPKKMVAPPVEPLEPVHVSRWNPDELRRLARKLGSPTVLDFLRERVDVLDKPSLNATVEADLITGLKDYLGQDDVILDDAESFWTCPVIRSQIVIPCDCRSCPLWAKAPDWKNCLGYMTDRRRKIKPKELGKLKNDKTLETLALRGELGIRGASFKELARVEGYPVFEFFPSDKVCCVCESRIMSGDHPENVGYRTNLVTCSDECRTKADKLELLCQYFSGMTMKNTKKYMRILLGKESRDNFLSALERLINDKVACKWVE
jgi:hypothetical protein